MKIYELVSDFDRVRHLTFKDLQATVTFTTDYFVFQTLPREAWKPPTIELMPEDQGLENPLPDYQELGSVAVFSRRAVISLNEVLNGGELLPLIFEGTEGHFFAYDPRHLAEALDESRSELKRFSNGGVMKVLRYEFRPDKLKDLGIFGIPQQRGRIYVTDEFVRRVNEARLTGFDFIELWSDEKPTSGEQAA
jgi:hypothetical protein